LQVLYPPLGFTVNYTSSKKFLLPGLDFEYTTQIKQGEGKYGFKPLMQTFNLFLTAMPVRVRCPMSLVSLSFLSAVKVPVIQATATMGGWWW
jgi:hypothetical protein